MNRDVIENPRKAFYEAVRVRLKAKYALYLQKGWESEAAAVATALCELRKEYEQQEGES